MKNVMITGASGFIGRWLVRRLVKEDIHVWTIERHFPNRVLPDSEKITQIKSDIGFDELKQLLKGITVDSFYHFAWQGVNGSDKGKYDAQVNNIMLTLKYAELAHILGCRKYLCAGTIAERAVDSLRSLTTASSGMMYGAAKYCSRIMLETYCKNIGLDFVWMQIANVYGMENKTGNLIGYTIDRIKKGEAAIFGSAKQPYDFIYVDDLIEAVYRLGMTETKDNFYYIGSGTPRILADYLKSIGKIYDRTDLIHIGERADDGIRYSYEMMDSSSTFAAIGNYISDTFENHVKHTIDYS